MMRRLLPAAIVVMTLAAPLGAQNTAPAGPRLDVPFTQFTLPIVGSADVLR
jgi:hypothetical protein